MVCPRLAVPVLFLLLLPSLSAAETPSCRQRSIALVFNGDDSPALTDFRHEVEDQVSRNPCYRMIDVVVLLEAGVSPAQGLVQQGMTSLDQGLRHVEEMRLEEAVPLLRESVDSLGRAFSHLAHPRPLVQALLALGGVLAATGDPKGAREALIGAFHLDPQARIEDVLVLPEALEAQEIARRILAAGRTGSLLVDSNPPGAEVWIDGTYRGPAPWDEPTIGAGLHFVTLRLPGWERKSLVVRVPDQGSASVTGEDARLSPARRRPLLESAKSKLARSGPDRDPSGGIEDLKALFLTDLLLVVDLMAEGTHAALWDLQTMDRVFQKFEPQTLSGDAIGRGTVVSLVMSAFRADLARFQVSEGPGAVPRRKPGIVNRWWFWTAIGVVAAGAVTAGVLLGRPGSSHPDGLSRDGTGSVIIRF
ncbi:PEGA domain-containing protein [Myxococcota bacterium]|nr:PEGA domain-containing protein [Myxococcota bacterium]